MTTPRIGFGYSAFDDRPVGLEALPDRFESELVKATERGQVRGGEGSVRQRRPRGEKPDVRHPEFSDGVFVLSGVLADRPTLSITKSHFIVRGNVIDLAVAVVIGAAFTTVVTALVDQLFNPLIGAVFNADSLANTFLIEIPTTAGGTATLGLGAILAAVINFLIVAAVVYFVFVLPINKLNERRAQGQEPETEVTELDVLTEIRDLLNERKK